MLKQRLHNEGLQSSSGGISSDFNILIPNPFPGLRPFSQDESHLFFGREDQIDEILSKLTRNRFVTVMGYSGSGKSSLMLCGLTPVLFGGFMTTTGTHWDTVTTRPGATPLRSLTNSVLQFMLSSGRLRKEDWDVQGAIIHSILKSGPAGLIEVARILKTDDDANIFFLVDQFEEVFRFRDQSGEDTDAAHDEAQHYVRLILTATQQHEVPIYTALAMRSDFVGECSTFPGLTQLINSSNYLIPQLTREQKKAVVEGPIMVAGGTISPRLVKRLLGDMGGDHDQLPVLQHALMRTWDYWVTNREPGEAIDVRHYNAIGRIEQALSQHANELYDELSLRDKEIAEVLFKSITEKTPDASAMRKPCSLSLVAELAEAGEDEVIAVVEHFRKSGRSFLMPAANIPLTGDSVIELSHESLIRIWNRLSSWVEDEFESASMYKRLSEAAAMYQIGKTGLWRPPDLQLALTWQKKQRPTRAWAQRYDEAFERAIVFLDTSRITYEAELKNQEMMQQRVLRRTRATAIILGIAFLVAILFFVFAYIQKLQADRDRMIADQNRQEADEQRVEAEKQRNEAQRLREVSEDRARDLEVAKLSLEDALNFAQNQRDRAEAAFLKAKVEEERARTAGEQEKVARQLAQKNAVEAQRNFEYANRLFMLTKAQELASKAAVQDDDADLAGLQAMQGYAFHRRFKGRKYDPYIYSGLYTALTKLSGVNYNAMKIQGPPRVHLRSLAVLSSGTGFYVSGADGRIYRGDYEKLTNSATGFETPFPSKVIAVSHGEEYLVNGSDSSFVHLYTLAGGLKPRVIKGFGGATNDIEFLPDDSGFLVASRDRTLSRVDVASGSVRKLVTLPYELKAISLSADGEWVAGASWSGQVVLIHLTDLSLHEIANDASSRALSVRFSPSGRYVAYGLDDHGNKRGIVRVYDREAKETRHFTGHRAGVYDVEFSPDEHLLASAGLDKRLQLYVLDAPEDLPVVMDNNTGFIWDIAFAKGSDFLIASCSESELRVWPTDPSLLAAQICPQLHRNMSDDEWKKYVGVQIPYEETCLPTSTKK